MAEGLDTQRAFALIFECETAMSLLNGGLRALAERSGSNDELHLPMQLLSQGLERLLKLTWALGRSREVGALPSHKEVKSVSHDLLRLDGEVLALGARCEEFVRRPLIQSELAFARDDPILRDMLSALSDFATVARYRDLDLLLGHAATIPDVRQRWSSIEKQVLELDPEWASKAADPAGAWWDVWYANLASDLVSRLQHYIRLIAFMWTLGPLGDLGRRYYSPLREYVHLQDDRFGEAPSYR